MKNKEKQSTHAATPKQAVELGAETVEAIADAIAERFERVAMPLILLHSRLCAADTVRTSERPDTVFRHAIKEAEIARTEIDKYFQATNV